MPGTARRNTSTQRAEIELLALAAVAMRQEYPDATTLTAHGLAKRTRGLLTAKRLSRLAIDRWDVVKLALREHGIHAKRWEKGRWDERAGAMRPPVLVLWG
jgi:hypothetical protein